MTIINLNALKKIYAIIRKNITAAQNFDSGKGAEIFFQKVNTNINDRKKMFLMTAQSKVIS